MTAKKKPNQSKAIELSSREAPDERKQSVTDFLMPLFNEAQMRLLVNKTPDYAIQKREGGNGVMLSYVKHGYVNDQLNKIFGFDWDLILDPIENGKMYSLQIEEEPRIDAKTNKPLPPKITRHLGVCGHLVVRVHDKSGKIIGTITKSGFGSQIWRRGMEFADALKSAESDLLKVCAAKVGVALDLYWNDMAEVEKYEQEQERKAEAEIINASFEDVPPATGPELIARAYSELGMDGKAVAEALGMNAISDVMKSFKIEYWEILKNANNKENKKG